MADLSITAGSVVGQGADRETLIAAGTVTAGMAVRKNTSNQIVAAANDSAANAAAYGIALNGASSGQPVEVQKSGLIDLGATVAVGKVYALSTGGGIMPVDDIAGSEYVTVMGVGTAADEFKMGICASGVAAAGAVS